MPTLTRFVCLYALLVLAAPLVPAQSSADLFNSMALHDIHLRLNPADWQRLRANYRENTYYRATLEWRGLRADSAGIRSRGNGSRNPVKPGLRVDFGRYEKSRSFLGLKALVLDNLTQDPPMMKDLISLEFFNRMRIPAPRGSYARLFINGEYWGLYAALEEIDSRFLQRVFGEESGQLYEYKWSGEWSFDYRGPDPAAYSPLPFKPVPDETSNDPAPLEALVRAVNQASDADFLATVSAYLDLTQVLRYVATENFLTEYDGFLSHLGVNNLYLYRFAGTTRFQLIPWDKDATLIWHEHPIWYNTSNNVLIRRALQIPELRRIYLDALAECAFEAGDSGGWLEEQVRRRQELIDAAALADTRKPYSNADYQEATSDLLHFARERAPFVVNSLQSPSTENQ